MPTLIDTQHAFDRLRREGGFSEEQADAIVDLFRDADEQVATRSDTERLDGRIGEAETHLKEHTENVVDAAEERIIRRLSVRLYAATTVLAAVLGALNYLMG